MIQTADQTLPHTLEEFINWESNDAHNGVARAIRMERWRTYKIYRNEKTPILYLHDPK